MPTGCDRQPPPITSESDLFMSITINEIDAINDAITLCIRALCWYQRAPRTNLQAKDAMQAITILVQMQHNQLGMNGPSTARNKFKVHTELAEVIQLVGHHPQFDIADRLRELQDLYESLPPLSDSESL